MRMVQLYAKITLLKLPSDIDLPLSPTTNQYLLFRLNMSSRVLLGIWPAKVENNENLPLTYLIPWKYSFAMATWQSPQLYENIANT